MPDAFELGLHRLNALTALFDLRVQLVDLCLDDLHGTVGFVLLGLHDALHRTDLPLGVAQHVLFALAHRPEKGLSGGEARCLRERLVQAGEELLELLDLVGVRDPRLVVLVLEVDLDAVGAGGHLHAAHLHDGLVRYRELVGFEKRSEVFVGHLLRIGLRRALTTLRLPEGSSFSSKMTSKLLRQ